MLLNFVDVFRRELSVVNFRRMRIRSGAVAEHRSEAASKAARHFLVDRGDATLDDARSDPQRGTVRTEKTSNLTGIALSGGGVRSASYCLGVLQALESLSPAGSPRPLDAVDYLSTVSGGGYIGTSMVAGMMQDNRTFPFESRLDEAETPETQHLRDFSNFLAPTGAPDYLVSIALVMRGLLVNALIVLPALLLLAVLTISFNPTVADLVTPFGISASKLPMLSTSDKASGLANQAVGKAKEGVGKAVGNDRLRAEGAAQEAKGKVQKAVGDAKSAVKDDNRPHAQDS